MTKNCLFADTPCQLVHEDKQGPNSWTLPVNLATFLNRCCQLNCVFMCDVVSSSHGLPRLNDRSSNRQKPPVCINPAIFMQQEKKTQVFAWLFYYKVISFSIWRILRLSLKWLSLNGVQRWTRAYGDMTATDSNGLSKSKCLLCNKGLRYLDIITQVSLMHVKFKTISNMHMVCRLDKNTCKLFQCDMVYLMDLSKFWFYVR